MRRAKLKWNGSVAAGLLLVCLVQAAVWGLPDLDVNKTDSPDPVTVGETLRYTIEITNIASGINTASNVVLTDYLPPEVSFVSAAASNGGCLELNGVVTCFLGNFPSGRTETVWIDVIPDSAGTIFNSAVASEVQTDADNSDNIDTITTTVEAAPVIIPTPTPTPTPQAEIRLNGSSFSAGEQFTATFVLNSSINRAFTAYAVVILPDQSMLNARTLDTPLTPVVTNKPSLTAPFSYPLLSTVVSQGAPTGNYEIVAAFFDPAGLITGRTDAFLEASALFMIQ